MKFNVILFDIDGVIVDSEPAHQQAFISTLKDFGIQMDASDYKRYFSSKPGPRAVKDFLIANAIDNNVDVIMEAKEDWYLKHSFQSIKGHDETIRFIKERTPSLSYGLVTSSLRKITHPALTLYSLTESFSTVVTLDDVQKGKPDPEGYLLAARDLKLNPDACAVVEDSRNGIQAAKHTVMYCTALTTMHAKHELAYADIIVAKLTTSLFL